MLGDIYICVVVCAQFFVYTFVSLAPAPSTVLSPCNWFLFFFLFMRGICVFVGFKMCLQLMKNQRNEYKQSQIQSKRERDRGKEPNLMSAMYGPKIEILGVKKDKITIKTTSNQIKMRRMFMKRIARKTIQFIGSHRDVVNGICLVLFTGLIVDLQFLLQ